MSFGGVRFKGIVQILGGFFATCLLMHTSHASNLRKKPAHPVHAAAAKLHRVVHRTIAVRHVVAHHPIAHRVIHRSRPIHHVVAQHHFSPHHRLHHLVRRTGYLWCVPYARQISHIELKGDAFLWWAEAAGRYARGYRPEDGAVLNFRPTHRMPLGHVAVVAKVINSRTVLVDQANWIPDTVTRNVPVIDVSTKNDWSKVEVALGNGKFGMTYPTYGFIYRQAPSNVVYANSGGTEVAEAPVVHKIRLSAPNRTLR